MRGYKGKEADRLVTRIDPGVVSLVPNSRELGRGKTRVEERKPLDASPTAITLAMLLTDGGTRWRRVLEVEKSRGADDQVDQMSQTLNRLRAMGSLPKFSPPMPRPPTGDRGWMA